MKQIIQTPNAPKAIGPYSQAVRVDKFLFLSGQIPLDPKTMEVVSGDITIQTKQCLSNIKAVLEQAHLNFSHIVKVTIFLKNMSDFPKVNETYGSYFEAPFPARSTVEVARLPKDVQIEIEAVAYQP